MRFTLTASVNCTKFGRSIFRKIIKIVCYQMSYFKAKMHLIRFRLRLCTGPRSGSLQRSPRPLARQGPIWRESKGEKRKGPKREREREGK